MKQISPMRVSKTLLLLYGTRHVVERWVRECYSVIQQPDIPTNRLVYPVPFNTIFPSGVP